MHMTTPAQQAAEKLCNGITKCIERTIREGLGHDIEATIPQVSRDKTASIIQGCIDAATVELVKENEKLQRELQRLWTLLRNIDELHQEGCEIDAELQAQIAEEAKNARI